MMTMDRWWRATLWAFAFILGTAGAASAVTFDLTADWRNINNPNGVWSLNEGPNPLPFRANYRPGQGAWAEAPFADAGHVPVWLKVEQQSFINDFGLSGLLVGDVTVHGRCCSDLPGTGEANVTWTSNLAGVATISGGTWWGGFAGRNVDWNIYINGVLVTGGNVGDGDPFDRNNPFNFANGSGGATMLTFNTNPGDTVSFEARKGPTSAFDHFIGVDFAIDVTPVVPEPGSLALFGLGLAGLGVMRRRRAASSASSLAIP